MGKRLASAARAATPGPVLFARYAYPPNRLGLCGPADAPALLDGAGAGADRLLRDLARGFEGAYPYLRLIADENSVADPLDPRIVEAYWLGNELSARVAPTALHGDLVERFRPRMGRKDWRWVEAALAANARPVHAFHVLEIFPRVGLLRGGREAPILETMDACRIRWGRVISSEGGGLVVSTRRLELADGRLRLGPERAETVGAWRDGAGLLGGVEPGEMVSVHWGWACDRLEPARLDRLVGSTVAALAVANQAV